MRLYPICIAGFVHSVLPLAANTFVYRANASHFFFYYLIFGTIFIFLPHAIIPWLGIVLGSLINKLAKKNA